MSASDTPRVPLVNRAAILASALFAIACVLKVGHKNPSGLLVTLFVLWVFTPYALLGVLFKSSRLWAKPKRAALWVLTICVCALSAVAYGAVTFVVQTPKPAFWFLMVPLASLLAIAVVYVGVLRVRPDRTA